MIDDITRQLNHKGKRFIRFSLAFDGSTDVTDTEQLSIFIRRVSAPFEVHEDVVAIAPMKAKMQGSDVKAAVEGMPP